ncbi:MAG: DUF1257 domain-containing protein [Anaerolineae bacterium]|nr:DUF1257 domain-containing protein [Anaerolineae bacterium]
MSHFTRVKTQLKDIKMVGRALEDLGHKIESGKVRGYGERKAPADLVVRLNDRYDIGFRQEGDTVSMVADLWEVPIDADRFLSQVSQRYAYLTVVEQTASQGWQVVTEENQADGSVRLVMQRWT